MKNANKSGIVFYCCKPVIWPKNRQLESLLSASNVLRYIVLMKIYEGILAPHSWIRGGI